MCRERHGICHRRHRCRDCGGNVTDTPRRSEPAAMKARIGAAWRLLPAGTGPCNRVRERPARWREKGARERAVIPLSAGGRLGWLMLGSTVARARSSAAEARKAGAARALGVHGAGSPASCTVPRGVRGPHGPAWPAAPATRFGAGRTDGRLGAVRAGIEGLFGQPRPCRRVFGRVDELACRRFAFARFAAACIRLRSTGGRAQRSSRSSLRVGKGSAGSSSSTGRRASARRASRKRRVEKAWRLLQGTIGHPVSLASRRAGRPFRLRRKAPR